MPIDSPLLSRCANPFNMLSSSSKDDALRDAAALHGGFPQAGLHLATSRGGLYDHHGIYADFGTVVHFAPAPSQAKRLARTRTTGLEDFDTHGSGISVVGRPAPGTFSSSVICGNALSKLGEADYDLLGNNCEHFATWCCSHVHQSDQVLGRLRDFAGLTTGWALTALPLAAPILSVRAAVMAHAGARALLAGLQDPEPFTARWQARRAEPTPVWLGRLFGSAAEQWSWMPLLSDAAQEGPSGAQNHGDWAAGLIGEPGAKWMLPGKRADDMEYIGEYWAASDGNVYIESTSDRWQRYDQAPWAFVQHATRTG